MLAGPFLKEKIKNMNINTTTGRKINYGNG